MKSKCIEAIFGIPQFPKILVNSCLLHLAFVKSFELAAPSGSCSLTSFILMKKVLNVFFCVKCILKIDEIWHFELNIKVPRFQNSDKRWFHSQAQVIELVFVSLLLFCLRFFSVLTLVIAVFFSYFVAVFLFSQLGASVLVCRFWESYFDRDNLSRAQFCRLIS